MASNTFDINLVVFKNYNSKRSQIWLKFCSGHIQTQPATCQILQRQRSYGDPWVNLLIFLPHLARWRKNLSGSTAMYVSMVRGLFMI